VAMETMILRLRAMAVEDASNVSPGAGCDSNEWDPGKKATCRVARSRFLLTV
jgi:hypothetical protein